MFLEKMLQKIKQECGAMVVLTAVLLPVMLGFAGLAVDVGNLYVHKTRLQNTADAAVMAGGMAYIDNLNKKKEKLADKSVSLSPVEVLNARSGMESAADSYIGKNNPLFMEKLNTNQGNNSKLYEIGTRTNSEDGKKSAEYFRVTLTETVPVHFLPVLGIQNVADVSVYATAKITDTEVKNVNNESGGTYHDGGEDPLVVAGTLLALGKNVTYDFKVYITGETKEIDNAVKKLGDKYYVRSSNGQYMEIDQSKKYNMDTFGEEIRKLFRQIRAERDPGSKDEYYMTYTMSGDIGNFNVSDISNNPENYGLKKDEHSYLYLSGTASISNFNIGSLYTGTLPSGRIISEDTPYYILVEKDVKISHLEIESSCTRPVVFCYLRESDSETVKFEFHNNKYGIQKSIYYAPHVKTWVQINNGNEFRGCIVSNKVEFGNSGGGEKNETHLKFDIEEIAKWQEGDDGLKFLPSIGFYDEPDPSTGPSTGSGGTTEVYNISLPDRLRFVLEGPQTDTSYYKDSEIEWTSL